MTYPLFLSSFLSVFQDQSCWVILLKWWAYTRLLKLFLTLTTNNWFCHHQLGSYSHLSPKSLLR
jgi:hypothetical protein